MADTTLTRAIKAQALKGRVVSFHPLGELGYWVHVDDRRPGHEAGVRSLVDTSRDDWDLEEATVYTVLALGLRLDKNIGGPPVNL